MNIPAATRAPDPARLDALMHRVVGDFGGAMIAVIVRLCDELGIFRVMADGALRTSADVAVAADCDERYVREMLCALAAGEYVDYDAASGRFSLSAEQAFALADRDSPAYVCGGFLFPSALAHDLPRLRETIRSGAGLGWHQHHPDLFCATERFFRPGYQRELVPAWLPALDGVVDKLTVGAEVADVGCGHGASTIIMAEAYPRSRFHGFDYHRESIDAARAAAERAGVAERVEFDVAPANGYPGGDYDLVCCFDCLHDMGDPVSAAAHVRSSLADDGTWMVVEPMAADRVEDNLNPIGKIFYSASSVVCCPASRDQEVGLALGAQAGEARMTQVIREGGFTSVRRAAENPFNMVLEARP